MSSDLIRSKQVRDTLVSLSRFAGKRFMLTTNGQESKDEYCAAYNSQNIAEEDFNTICKLLEEGGRNAMFVWINAMPSEDSDTDDDS